MAAELAEPKQIDTPDAVLEALVQEGLGENGFHHTLDSQHEAVFLERGPKLLVMFQLLEDAVHGAKLGPPVGLDFVEDKNYSLLYLGTRGDTWFRSLDVFEFFDDLVDDSFFEEFDQVMFYGAGIGAYAACAYSVASPGAQVMAVAPQATLDMDRAGWDKRFPSGRLLDFSDRYGFAPDMLEGAAQAFLLFDPFRPLDFVHASLFHSSNVTHLKCRHLNGLIDVALQEMDILHRTIEACATGELTHASFYQLFRARREHNRYLRTILSGLEKRNKPRMAALLCKFVLAKRQGPVFRKALANAEKILKQRDQLPDWLRDPDARAFNAETSQSKEGA